MLLRLSPLPQHGCGGRSPPLLPHLRRVELGESGGREGRAAQSRAGPRQGRLEPHQRAVQKGPLPHPDPVLPVPELHLQRHDMHSGCHDQGVPEST